MLFSTIEGAEEVSRVETGCVAEAWFVIEWRDNRRIKIDKREVIDFCIIIVLFSAGKIINYFKNLHLLFSRGLEKVLRKHVFLFPDGRLSRQTRIV